jgi:hypothetical protein
MNRFSSNLAEKLDALSPEQISAVDEFIELLRARPGSRCDAGGGCRKRTCFRGSVE